MAKNNNKKNKNGIWGLIISILIIIVVILSVYMLQIKNKEDETTLAYTDLIKQISAENIAKIEMTTGSTTIKVTLVQEIKDGEVVKDGL